MYGIERLVVFAQQTERVEPGRAYLMYGLIAAGIGVAVMAAALALQLRENKRDK